MNPSTFATSRTARAEPAVSGGGQRSAESSKYLTFQLAGEELGLEILKVREIIGVTEITAIPRMPRYMKGVINLRGTVVPIVDLRLKFDLEEAAHTEQTCIILVDVGHQVGLVVDTVSEVLEIRGDQIDPPPRLGRKVDTSFILGMGKVGDRVKVLLNIDRVLGQEDMHAVRAALSKAADTTAAG